ncbi:MAG: alkaline phosphatase family protein, partial [Capsulimonadales bacterium]|nr:alkaline phosphatase family protein [Capsulimonadales bacterium]
MRRLTPHLIPALTLISALPALAQESPYLRAPAGKEYAKIVPGGTTILPNGRFLTPKGERLYTGGDLWNVAVRPDGKVLVSFSENAVVVYALPARTGDVPRVLRTKGLAPVGVFTPDGSRLILSNGDEGGIEIYDTNGWDTPPAKPAEGRFVMSDLKPLQTISVKDAEYDAPYLNDIALSPDGRHLFAVDVAHQRVVTIDLTAGKVVATAKAGREPYALALSPEGKSLFIANIGIFDYSVIPPPMPGGGSNRGLSRPPFGFPSKESEVGVLQEGRKVPGLGKPYVPDAQSVWMYDVSTPAMPVVKAKATSGILIHAPADAGKSVGGSAPNKLLLFGKKLFVANANNDTVQVFDADTLKSLSVIKLSPSPMVAKYRGVIPSGMTMNKAGTRLYVSESGLNAVAVIDATNNKVLGHIPTGWFPVQLALSPDERTLFVSTQKGLGRGPRGEKQKRTPDDERYGLTDMPGMVNAVPLPDDSTLNAWTAEVLSNNGLVDHKAELASLPPSAMARVPGKPSDKIKYVVFITKENHTFDGIFGGLKGAKGEPDYAEFGMQGWIAEKGKAERMPIMPNHIRLAEQFAISDNFYMEPQASGDGHRWLVGVYPSLWTTRVFYSGWNYKQSDKTKGRLVSFGSDGSQIPEDYLENGSLWEHLQRGNITFRNYGEGYELPQTDEGPMTNKAGTYYMVNYPMPKALFDNTCFDFPAYNNFIPDIARADWFVEDLEKYRKKNKGQMPRFLNIAICNDHGFDPRPKDGYPYVCSGMADNDLALGRIVDYLSHQPEWKNMAIFVTQDDSGGDNDHIDRHRSFVLCISPYAKRGYISRDHTSIMSILKTIYLIFGLGPNNMFDALATDLSDMMTDKPDFTPYVHVPSNRT